MELEHCSRCFHQLMRLIEGRHGLTFGALRPISSGPLLARATNFHFAPSDTLLLSTSGRREPSNGHSFVSHNGPASVSSEPLQLSQPASGVPLAVTHPAKGKMGYSGDTGQLKAKLEDKGIKLFAVRHGQSEMNAQGVRLAGQVETPLTELGRQQALEGAKSLYDSLGADLWLSEVALHPEKAPAVYASPLSRASDTAQIFVDYLAGQARRLGVQLQVPVVKDDRLKEIAFGRYDGKPVTEAQQAHPELLVDGNLAQRFPEGESRLETVNRVSSFLNDAAGRHQDQPVLMFCHLVPVAAAQILMGEGTTSADGSIEIRRKIYPNASPLELTHPRKETEIGYLLAR